MSCHSHFQTCPILLPSRCQVTGHHSITDHRAILYSKGKQHVVNNPDLTWGLQDVEVFGHRVSYFTAGWARNTAGQDVKRNQ